MPELPEVETMRRGVALAESAPITAIVRPRSALQSICIEPPLPKFRRRAVGRRIAHVGRLGKRVILELDSGDRIVMEPRMTGLVLLADPPDRKHLRLVIELSGPGVTQSTGCPGAPAEQILFWDQRGLGVVRLVSPAEFDRLYGPAKIGPDALEISVEELADGSATALGRSRSHCSIKRRWPAWAICMPRKSCTGPAFIRRRSCRRLRKAQWQSVHAEMLRVLNDAIQHQGSTLRDGTYRIARDAPGNYQYNHRVYQRHGQACLACGKAQIMRIVQAQRSTFYCPACQRK